VHEFWELDGPDFGCHAGSVHRGAGGVK
jgi:hypothetical protein